MDLPRGVAVHDWPTPPCSLARLLLPHQKLALLSDAAARPEAAAHPAARDAGRRAGGGGAAAAVRLAADGRSAAHRGAARRRARAGGGARRQRAGDGPPREPRRRRSHQRVPQLSRARPHAARLGAAARPHRQRRHGASALLDHAAHPDAQPVLPAAHRACSRRPEGSARPDSSGRVWRCQRGQGRARAAGRGAGKRSGGVAATVIAAPPCGIWNGGRGCGWRRDSAATRCSEASAAEWVETQAGEEAAGGGGNGGGGG